MDVSQYVAQLREDLASAAAAGDEQTRRTAALLGAAIEPAARLAVMNALSDLAAEVTASLGDRVVEVRLDGRDVRVVVTGEEHDHAHEPEPEPAPPPPPPPGADAGDISRITLRLVEQIKGQAEQAAAAQGVSLNSWVAQAVQGALSGRNDWGRGNVDRGSWDRGGWDRGDRGDRGGRGRGGRPDDGRRVRGWVQG
ncbi:MAG: toxin-antitoxin system HicB family antitoxin [Pseudonocardia sp.]|uniref:toxin-antitoxin system HicB family antitoxin n=1 Tax=unclassified Pseudonocardia TaxID=2619320 RepID=UPI00086ADE9A|nr:MULTISPECIES: toxin-antitoxin system HicB family antitoxin [unclassified Pseudonocardia]MBN9110963.1 toxin-antitoxin system HicB family antitoxin [Pseudonocardia sp.]ODU25031.1 MAG: HicB family protein [Pseudonocardia sp. SCN 72-51]ODV05013.1 MAG: HicB family protein [Pseudonocardia sp. SCN 73-27]